MSTSAAQTKSLKAIFGRHEVVLLLVVAVEVLIFSLLGRRFLGCGRCGRLGLHSRFRHGWRLLLQREVTALAVRGAGGILGPAVRARHGLRHGASREVGAMGWAKPRL